VLAGDHAGAANWSARPVVVPIVGGAKREQERAAAGSATAAELGSTECVSGLGS